MSNQPISLSTLAIRRHIGTLIITIAVMVLGWFVVSRMPVDLLPSITYPRIGLRADAPGIVPEVAVNDITRPLEEALTATEGVVQLFSRTREGRISIDLFFRPGNNIDQALNDATAALNRARDRLPDGLDAPRLFKFDPSQLPVYEMALTSTSLRAVDLRIFADEELARELVRVPGVANVDISGGVREEVRMNLDLDRLQALGLNVEMVSNALRERNQDTAGGLIRGGPSELLTRVAGRFNSVQEIRRISISSNGNGEGNANQQLYVEDVAQVIDGTEEQRVFVTLNGQPAVKVSIQKQPDANTIEVVEGVVRRLQELREAAVIPEDMQIETTLDESRFIRSSIQNVITAGLSGAGLAAIAVLLFLGSLRQTLIVVLAIPLATLTAMILMGLFGLSLNVFSLGGLALGVGIVVDNAIVMLENIAKGVETTDPQSPVEDSSNGYALSHLSPKQQFARRVRLQAETSARELESALLASTSTNLVAVLPFLMLGGFISLLFNELILTISFAVAASMAIALTVVPAMAARLLGIPRSLHLNRLPPIWLFGRFVRLLTAVYRQILSGVLRMRLLTIALAILVLGGGSLWMAERLPQEILPRINTGQARLVAQFPPGTTVSQNRQVMAAVDEMLLSQPETQYAFSTAGGFLFGTSTSANSLRGSSTIALTPGTNVGAYVGRVNRQITEEIPLVDTSIRMRPESVRGLILSNSPTRDDIDIMLQGTNPQVLEEAGRMVLAALEENATLASYQPDAEDPQPEVRIRPDWERAASVGLSAQRIGETIQTALEGSVITQIQREDRLVNVRMQLPTGTIERPSRLRSIPLFTSGNQLIRLGDIAEIGRDVAPGEIQRINQRQIFLIEGSLSDGANLSDALDEVDAILAGLDLPEGVTRVPSSAAETNEQLRQSLVILGSLATFMVFVVMAVQYNSLIDPLAIILTVPLALAGGILGLYITETAVGATAIVGAVLLVGIVVNNAILLVELANQIREKQGLSHYEAMLEAAPQRLRPILMTTITTVLGLFPLALGVGEGSEFLQPLGIVVFSGLSLATFLTLFIVPCFYTLLHRSNRPRKPRLPSAGWQESPVEQPVGTFK
ncbi:efflux RND transporter permease subunit [Phormidium yuhuli AB48]|uniref:Efflux RND transporter permease subunit n=1 Tax=Phormidium yuhuli AB48 TaxID=2940671 RepID=A0ABY5AUR7_9CYAN|nr:efflux RND transporter permease subunit [Phormidium yuhuli]USR91974.1 efflux RND transporter permease subunit [Phormidium yuhuli AB48]